MERSPENQGLDDRDQPGGDGAEPSEVSVDDGSSLAEVLCLAPVAFALLTWSFVGQRSLAQTGLTFAVNAVILALMIGLVRQR